MAGHVPMISDWDCVVVGCDLVNHGGMLSVGAEGGQNYTKAPNGEGRNQHWLLDPGVLKEGTES